MPTYQYLCTECGEPLEAQQSFSDPALTDCPACGGRLRKVFNAVGVVFKGSGFYRNDSREADKSATSTKTEKKTDGTSSGDSGSSSTPKSESSSGSETKSKTTASA